MNCTACVEVRVGYIIDHDRSNLHLHMPKRTLLTVLPLQQL
jgi:hypothetical protein